LKSYSYGIRWMAPSTYVGGTGTSGYVPRWTGSSTLGNSAIRSTVTNVSIGTTPSSSYGLYVYPSSGITPIRAIGTNYADGIYISSNCPSTGYATVYAVQSNSSGMAGKFYGDVYIGGTLSKSSGSFLIDHPDDPLNKTLRHNFVESPENLCLYRGLVKIDQNGKGTFKLPDYFKSLTKEDEATVTLTAVGVPFDLGYEWNASFTEVTVYGEPGRKASYIVMADRDDPVMKKLYHPVVEEKSEKSICKKGVLLDPEAYGYAEEYGANYQKEKEMREREEQENTKQREQTPQIFFDEEGSAIPAQLVDEYRQAGYPLYTAREIEEKRIERYRRKLESFKKHKRIEEIKEK
ncbi:MAG: hypothetical protein K9H84_08595, partial [Bacteroidales bacterium]|nr:hypothetical protein [Bacteroidales bacterium]